MTNGEKLAQYKGMTDHDLLINIATRMDIIESTVKRIVYALCIAGGGSGIFAGISKLAGG